MVSRKRLALAASLLLSAVADAQTLKIDTPGTYPAHACTY